MSATNRPLDDHLEAALDAATDKSARYHIREALQLRVIESELDDGDVSAD